MGQVWSEKLDQARNGNKHGHCTSPGTRAWILISVPYRGNPRIVLHYALRRGVVVEVVEVVVDVWTSPH
jgi:hypothetical protein